MELGLLSPTSSSFPGALLKELQLALESDICSIGFRGLVQTLHVITPSLTIFHPWHSCSHPRHHITFTCPPFPWKHSTQETVRCGQWDWNLLYLEGPFVNYNYNIFFLNHNRVYFFLLLFKRDGNMFLGPSALCSLHLVEKSGLLHLLPCLLSLPTPALPLLRVLSLSSSPACTASQLTLQAVLLPWTMMP